MTDQERAAMQQALELLGTWTNPPARLYRVMDNLRVALAQQQAGSWQDGVLEGHLRERERWLAQQAEPKGGGNLPPPLQAEPVQEPVGQLQEAAFGRGQVMWFDKPADGTKLYTTTPPQPVDVGLLEYRGNSVAFIHQKMTAYRAGIDAAWDAFRAKGLHPDGKTPLANMIAKYTAPPQRQPQTIDEAMRLPRAMAQAYENGYKAGVAHEREECAKVCEQYELARSATAAIRARGEQS